MKQFLLIVFSCCLTELLAQIETINYTREEFQKINTLSEALKDFPKDCKIENYEISMVIGGASRSSKNYEGPVNSIRSSFFNVAKKEGGIIIIEKIKANCPSSAYKSKYKLVIK